jgi:P-type Ca2+ transporter type 2B
LVSANEGKLDIMATIDGRPAQYGVTLKQLRELMELRGREGVNKINGYGGVQEICKKLYTSPNEGKSILCVSLNDRAFSDERQA